jgi:hypothetical protein
MSDSRRLTANWSIVGSLNRRSRITLMGRLICTSPSGIRVNQGDFQAIESSGNLGRREGCNLPETSRRSIHDQVPEHDSDQGMSPSLTVRLCHLSVSLRQRDSRTFASVNVSVEWSYVGFIRMSDEDVAMQVCSSTDCYENRNS